MNGSLPLCRDPIAPEFISPQTKTSVYVHCLFVSFFIPIHGDKCFAINDHTVEVTGVFTFCPWHHGDVITEPPKDWPIITPVGDDIFVINDFNYFIDMTNQCLVIKSGKPFTAKVSFEYIIIEA